MELFESEIEIYNSKMRLLDWLYNELEVQPYDIKEVLTKKGQDLPLNI
ncbi:MAG: hypothetical protein ACTSRI_19560 [Promethearchaeota archaeon]